jgi:hypothetical protein
MNSWPFFEVKRQVEYKSAWKGVPVITLTKGETRGTTMDCAKCGERLQCLSEVMESTIDNFGANGARDGWTGTWSPS